MLPFKTIRVEVTDARETSRVAGTPLSWWTADARVVELYRTLPRVPPTITGGGRTQERAQAVAASEALREYARWLERTGQ